jgi:hypothetical protein
MCCETDMRRFTKTTAEGIPPIHEALQQGMMQRKEMVDTFQTRLKESGSKARAVVHKERAGAVL